MKDYLICIDSDGTAIDTMTIKHQKCFGPLILPIFNIKEHHEEILKRWDEINLYSNLRGINRFLGLQIILKEINDKYQTIIDLENYNKWCDSTKIFSQKELENYNLSIQSECINKVISWSKKVNEAINNLNPLDKKAFSKVKETLAYCYQHADIAIVSSANKKAVEEEWKRCELLNFTSYTMTQEDGTKTECINKLINLGYKQDNIIMLGDSNEDFKAAKANNIHYYPIIPKKENESWINFKNEEFNKFIKLK